MGVPCSHSLSFTPGTTNFEHPSTAGQPDNPHLAGLAVLIIGEHGKPGLDIQSQWGLVVLSGKTSVMEWSSTRLEKSTSSRILPLTFGNLIRRLPETMGGFFLLGGFTGGLLSAQNLSEGKGVWLQGREGTA
jgi:hypothetical protein